MSTRTMSHFPNRFAAGVSLGGLPALNTHPNNVFWVSSETGIGSDGGNKGTTPQRPFATLEYAKTRCKDNKGDVIYVMPNHTETVDASNGVDLDVAGISVIGLGRGTNMPRIDYTATAGIFSVGASDVTITNLNFHANVPSVVTGLDIEDGSDNTLIAGCRFDVETTITDDFDISINNNNNANYTLIEDCDLDAGLGGATHGILFTADSANSVVRNNLIQGDYSVANIGGITTLSTNLLIEDNLLISGASGAIGTVALIVMLTGTTGVVRRNMFLGNLATGAAYHTADAMWFGDNQYGDEVGGDNCTTSGSDGTVALASITQHSDG